jgi:hypothetical protein
VLVTGVQTCALPIYSNTIIDESCGSTAVFSVTHDAPEKDQLLRVIENRDRIKEIFESLDLHHCGRVTALELQEALRNHGVLGSLKHRPSPVSSTHVSLLRYHLRLAI